MASFAHLQAHSVKPSFSADAEDFLGLCVFGGQKYGKKYEHNSSENIIYGGPHLRRRHHVCDQVETDREEQRGGYAASCG